MPIYEYRCRNGHEFEVFQSMSEDPVARCGECGAPVERVFHAVAVHFKGSGFYTTDYAKAGSKPGAGSDGAGPDSDSGKGDSGKSESAKGSGKASDSKDTGGKAKAASSGD
jgi:putative FmdB family regulatory protein